MKEFIIEITPYIYNIVLALVGFVATKVVAFINDKISQDKQDRIAKVVKASVDWVEMVSQTNLKLVGKEKYIKARDRALVVLHQKNLQVTNEELDMLIEQFVLELQNLGGE